MTTVTFKTPDSVKSESKRIFSEMGIDMSSAINLFLRQVIREQGLPFTPSLIPNKATLKALKDVSEGKELHGPFNSFDEMLEDIMDAED